MNQPDTDPPPPDPAQTLPRDVYFEIVRTLHTYLDPFLEGPEDERARQLRAATAAVCALSPGNPDEARLGARYVAGDLHAAELLRLSRVHAADIKVVMQLSARAADMSRTANGTRSLLLRVQAARHKRDGDPQHADADEWGRHIAQSRMTEAQEALARHPPPPAARPSAPPAPISAAAPPPVAQPAPPAPVALTPEQERAQDLLREADMLAIIHPLRSRLIRRLGALPPDCGIEPPRPELMPYIIHGQTCNQRWADNLTLEQARMNGGRDREFLWRYEEEAAVKAVAA